MSICNTVLLLADRWLRRPGTRRRSTGSDKLRQSHCSFSDVVYISCKQSKYESHSLTINEVSHRFPVVAAAAVNTQPVSTVACYIAILQGYASLVGQWSG